MVFCGEGACNVASCGVTEALAAMEHAKWCHVGGVKCGSTSTAGPGLPKHDPPRPAEKVDDIERLFVEEGCLLLSCFGVRPEKPSTIITTPQEV